VATSGQISMKNVQRIQRDKMNPIKIPYAKCHSSKPSLFIIRFPIMSYNYRLLADRLSIINDIALLCLGKFMLILF
jgi:hypothetical protein